MSIELHEVARRLANVARAGTVMAVDHSRSLVRVRFGETTSDWVPWAESRAGKTRSWSPPTIGEQVMVLSPSGDRGLGVAISAINSDKIRGPFDDPNVDGVKFADDSIIAYDEEKHRLEALFGDDGSALIECGDSIIEIDKDEIKAERKDGTILISETSIDAKFKEASINISADEIKAVRGDGMISISQTDVVVRFGSVGITISASGISAKGPFNFTQ